MAEEKLVVDSANLLDVTIPAMMTEKSNLEDSYSRMQTTINGLVTNGYMDSETGQAYVDEFNSLLSPDIAKLIGLIESYYTQLGQICENFATHDQSMASNIS